MKIRHDLYSAPRGERSDCGVRALSVATGVCYDSAYAALARAGRKPRCWSYISQLALALVSLSLDHRATMYTRGGGGAGVVSGAPTLARFLREHPSGRFIVRRRGHFFAVVDGIVHDRADARTSARHIVADAIEIL